MKHIFLISLFVFAGFCTFAQKTFKTAVEFNDFLITEQIKIGESIKKFNETTATGDSTNCQLDRLAIVKQANASYNEVNKCVAFKGGDLLKKSTMSLFKFYEQSASNEYNEVVKLMFNKSITAETMKEKFDVLLNTIVTNEAKLDEAFKTAQEVFAKANNFTLTENTFKVNDEK